MRDIRLNICAVHTCENNNGTSIIKMFKFPEDAEQNKLWREALGITENKFCRGLICMKHFNHEDIIGVKRQKLRKGAIPVISHVSESCKIQKIQTVDKNELNGITDMSKIDQESIEMIKFDSFEASYPFYNSSNTNSEECDLLKLEINDLKRKHLQMQVDHTEQISKIMKQLDKTTANFNDLKKQTDLLRKKYAYEKLTNKKLRSKLMTLRNKNLLDKETIDFVKVSDKSVMSCFVYIVFR